MTRADSLRELPDALSTDRIEAFLRRKYTVHADARQRAMGLEYITAGVDDLAIEIASYIRQTLDSVQ